MGFGEVNHQVDGDDEKEEQAQICDKNPQVNLNNSTVFEESVHNYVFHSRAEQAVDKLCKLINSTAHEEDDSTANCSSYIVRP
jgi:hypothetical protein